MFHYVIYKIFGINIKIGCAGTGKKFTVMLLVKPPIKKKRYPYSLIAGSNKEYQVQKNMT